jgi:LPS sulfotransferase NodH
MEPIGAGKHEVNRIEDMCSVRWDSLDAMTPRLRYLVFSIGRTRSELLCAYLVQRAIGVPFEYFHQEFMRRISTRLGCLNSDGRIDVQRYVTLLESKRTRNGVFGVKLQPNQLLTLSGDDIAKANALLHRFHKVILLRRRDKLLQAISMARAHLTNQWHVYKDDEVKRFSASDDAELVSLIGTRLGRIREDEQYMKTLASAFDPSSVRILWYEDLSDPSVLAATARWLWDASGAGSTLPEPNRAHELPTKTDEGEAKAIKARFLSAVGICLTDGPEMPGGGANTAAEPGTWTPPS